MQERMRIEDRIIRIGHGIVDWIFVLMILVLYSFGLYAIWDTYTIVDSASPVQYELYKPEEDPLSFEELRELNSDVFGWLTIYGTNIDYPLLQGENNQEYLSTAADGSYSMTGSIFLDYRCNPSFEAFNSIIHGHYMQYGVMFGDMGNFREKSYFDEHLYGNLYYDGKDHGVELFSFLRVDAYDPVVYTPNLTRDEEKNRLLDRLETDAVYYRDIGVTGEDHIVLFSTCTLAAEDERYILAGRITDEIYDNAFATEESGTTTLEKAQIVVNITPWWMYLLSLILLTICGILLKNRMRERMTREDLKKKEEEK
jgi:sortase B